MVVHVHWLCTQPSKMSSSLVLSVSLLLFAEGICMTHTVLHSLYAWASRSLTIRSFFLTKSLHSTNTCCHALALHVLQTLPQTCSMTTSHAVELGYLGLRLMCRCLGLESGWSYTGTDIQNNTSVLLFLSLICQSVGSVKTNL